MGDRLAVADGVAGVRLYDVSTPTSPVALGTVALDQPAAGVALAGDVVYVAAHTLGLVVVDFSGTPTITASLLIDGGDALRVHVAAGRAWVAAGYAGLRIFDLSSPTTPAPVATYFVGGNMIMATDVAVDVPSQRAYVADFWRQVTVLDLAPVLTGAPAHDPVAITSAKDSGYTQGIAVSAGRAWVAGDTLAMAGDRLAVFSRYRGVDFYDVTDRQAPKHLGNYETGNASGSVTIDDARAYVGHGDAVVVLDLAADASSAAPGITALSELMTDGLVKDVAIDGETLRILSGTRILVASVDAGTGTLSPIAAVPSPGRAPVSLRVRGGVVLASDKVEPLLRLSLGCTSAPVTYAATGTPSAGAQWVDLATGAAP